MGPTAVTTRQIPISPVLGQRTRARLRNFQSKSTHRLQLRPQYRENGDNWRPRPLGFRPRPDGSPDAKIMDRTASAVSVGPILHIESMATLSSAWKSTSPASAPSSTRLYPLALRESYRPMRLFRPSYQCFPHHGETEP